MGLWTLQMPADSRLPAPWRVIDHDESFEVQATDSQNIAYVYFDDTPVPGRIRPRLSRDMARRVAANIAKLPQLKGAARQDGLCVCRKFVQLSRDDRRS
jgi:hypothetical protein